MSGCPDLSGVWFIAGFGLATMFAWLEIRHGH